MNQAPYLRTPFAQPTVAPTPAPLGTALRAAQLDAGAPRVRVCGGCGSVTQVAGAWDESVGRCGACPAAPAPLPVAPGEDDRVMIFTSRLRTSLGDGASLAPLVARLVARAPQVGDQVITLGGLGAESFGRAVETLRVYRDTRVIQAPRAL